MVYGGMKYMDALQAQDYIKEITDTAKAENTRVSNSTNIELNKKVFKLVEQAIPVLEKLEEFALKIEIYNEEIRSQKNEPAWKTGHKVLFVILAIALGFAEFWIYSNFLDVIETQYNYDWTHLDEARVLTRQTYPFTKFLNLFYWLAEVVILNIVMRIIVKNQKPQKDSLFEANMQSKISEVEQERDAFIQDNAAALMVVPPTGISSQKMKYAYHFYVQGQADNLKEALILADTKDFRETETSILKDMKSSLYYIERYVSDFGSWY